MENLDVIIIGAGIGGVICAKYAKDAGLSALVLEKESSAGGIWRDLPSWQDIQIKKEDWTLGTIPLEGPDQQNVLKNIEAWIREFELEEVIAYESKVMKAHPTDHGWDVETKTRLLKCKFLVVATGIHGSPYLPSIPRKDSLITESHSMAVREPGLLKGKRVAVIGAGASALDLLELAVKNEAAEITWIYRRQKWIFPTYKEKSSVMDLRGMARSQMLGISKERVNARLNEILRVRYKRFGLEDILPDWAAEELQKDPAYFRRASEDRGENSFCF
jgi:cation diffusion facilitator CzcD-associated flavoprotein CzcO